MEHHQLETLYSLRCNSLLCHGSNSINNFQYQQEGAAIPKLLVSGVQN